MCGLAARKGGDVSRHHLEDALPRLEPLPTWLGSGSGLGLGVSLGLGFGLGLRLEPLPTDVRREDQVVEVPERAVRGRPG